MPTNEESIKKALIDNTGQGQFEEEVQNILDPYKL
jgi:hypothetical protein